MSRRDDISQAFWYNHSFYPESNYFKINGGLFITQTCLQQAGNHRGFTESHRECRMKKPVANMLHPENAGIHT